MEAGRPRTYGKARTDGAPKPSVPCWLCGRRIIIRTTKEGKPFLVCMDCGLQMFIRSAAGTDRLWAFCVKQVPDGEIQEERKP